MIEYWTKKSGIERVFWIVFIFLILLFLFFHFSFANLYERYVKAQKILESVPKDLKEDLNTALLEPSEITQQILRKNPKIKILEFRLGGDGITHIVSEGSLKDLNAWFCFIENFKQNKITDFKFYQDIKMRFEVSFKTRI